MLLRPAKTFRMLAIATCLGWMTTGPACAEGVSFQPAPLTLELEQLKLHRTLPVYRAFVTAQSGKFTFLIPAGLRVKGGSEDRIKLGNLEGNVLITFAVVDPSPCGKDPLDADVYREIVQARHPKGKIIEQLCPGAAGRIGIGFDMQWETTNKFAQCTRTVFIPSAAGLLEFTATAGPQNISSLRYDLNQIMIGFRAATPNEELEVPKVSEGGHERSDAGNLQGKGQRHAFLRPASGSLSS